jgi:hypothetical protein
MCTGTPFVDDTATLVRHKMKQQHEQSTRVSEYKTESVRTSQTITACPPVFTNELPNLIVDKVG